MNLMKFKIWYFVFSIALILPGLYFLITFGFQPGIDFTGGTLLEYRFAKEINIENLKQFGQVSKSSDREYIIKTKPLESSEIQKIKQTLIQKFGEVEEKRVESIGPILGLELQQKAILALAFTSLVIILYISFSFRKVPKPFSSFRFGICAIVALLHDVIMVLGFFAIFGKFFGVEVDSLFVTALLTIIGFSVHDTIVVFDRIRENSIKYISKNFIEIANISVIQTLGRSLTTSLTVVFVLLAMLLFGGETLRWFIVALLIGIISGTYSSIFNATALLVWWEEKLGH